MSEYLNYSGLVVLSFFFILFSILKVKEYRIFYLFAILYAGLIYDGYNQYSTVQTNVKQFSNSWNT